MQRKAYSDSLRKMIGLKIFKDIDPLTIKIRRTERKQLTFLKQSKKKQELDSIKKQIMKNKEKKDGLEKQINRIVQRLIQKDQDNLISKRIQKRGSYKHYRILTQADEKPKFQHFPSITTSLSTNKIRTRFKTQNEIEKSYGQKSDVANVTKYVKHYREGKSSIKKIKYKHQ